MAPHLNEERTAIISDEERYGKKAFIIEKSANPEMQLKTYRRIWRLSLSTLDPLGMALLMGAGLVASVFLFGGLGLLVTGDKSSSLYSAFISLGLFLPFIIYGGIFLWEVLAMKTLGLEIYKTDLRGLENLTRAQANQLLEAAERSKEVPGVYTEVSKSIFEALYQPFLESDRLRAEEKAQAAMKAAKRAKREAEGILGEVDLGFLGNPENSLGLDEFLAGVR